MRISYFIHKNWYPPRAGSGIHAYQVAANLSRRGHNIQTIFTTCDDPVVERFRPWQIGRFLLSTDAIYIRIFEAFRTGKFGLLKLLKARHCPVIWEVNAPLEEQLLTGKSRGQVARWQHQRTLLAHLVDACICNTPALAEYARRQWRIRHCFVVPLGSDSQLFSPDKKCGRVFAAYHDRFKVVWAGTPQFRWHGLPLLYRVATAMGRIAPDVVFIAIGMRNSFRKYGPIPDNLIVLDEVPYLQMPAYLASADVGLCMYDDPLRGIDFYRSPLKLFDYMAAGLPVVATSAPEMSRIIRHGQSGLLAETHEDAIVDAILELKRNRQSARAMSVAARKDIERYFNWSRVAADTESVIQWLRRR